MVVRSCEVRDGVKVCRACRVSSGKRWNMKAAMMMTL